MIFFDPRCLDAIPPPPLPLWLALPYVAIVTTYLRADGDALVRTCILSMN